MNKSETIDALAAALAKAQGAMGGAAKGAVNPHFKSRYADLAAVVEAIKEPLSVNGLSYVQVTEPSDRNEVRVETVLMHASGQWVSSMTAVPVNKADAQGYGSALTYARRYGLMAIAGVPAEDDDGNGATGAKPTAKGVMVDAALLDEAGREANSGTEAYRAFWQRITQAQRESLASEHERLKGVAMAATKVAA